ncbi:unnamed protein product, partial [Ostreobium quekettii]
MGGPQGVGCYGCSPACRWTLDALRANLCANLSTMSGSDDEEPPPLSGDPRQVEALESRVGCAEGEGGWSASNAGQAGELGSSLAWGKSLKRGFLSASRRRKRAGGRDAQPGAEEAIPVLRGSPNRNTNAGSIPDFMHIPAAKEMERLEAAKKDLLQKLRPTEESVRRIQEDPVLAAGFDDPEVMAAVHDIALDSGRMRAYAHNRKVVEFYRAMGVAMGQQLE